MLPKRSDDSGITRRGSDDTAVVVEALRVGGEPAKPAKPEDERISLFWRVFGGAILSICALVGITLFNNLMSTITELRSEINKLNEHRTELVRKDEFNSRMTSTWERVQSLQTQNNTQITALTSQRTELDGYKERLARHATDLDAARKDAGTALDGLKKEMTTAIDGLKKEVAAVEHLRERVKAVEAVRKDLAVVEALKEKVAALVADAKVYREEYQKLRQDVDKNQTADQERKVSRDEQYRELEKAFKELRAAVQDCQVKLARLEGTAAPKTTPDKEKAGSEKPGTDPGKSNDGGGKSNP